MVRLLVAIALVTAVAGCGRSGDRDEARAAAERFYEAVRQDRGEVACAELSEATASAVADESGQPCAAAITDADYASGAVVGVEVYITSARVELRGGESAFLDRGPDGWRISAVACRAQDGPPSVVPMDCEVEA
jgi:putative lipoprotein